MAIIITDEPDVYMTKDEHARLSTEYQQAFMMFAGTPPSFETWVLRKRQDNKRRAGTSALSGKDVMHLDEANVF